MKTIFYADDIPFYIINKQKPDENEFNMMGGINEGVLEGIWQGCGR